MTLTNALLALLLIQAIGSWIYAMIRDKKSKAQMAQLTQANPGLQIIYRAAMRYLDLSQEEWTKFTSQLVVEAKARASASIKQPIEDRA